MPTRLQAQLQELGGQLSLKRVELRYLDDIVSLDAETAQHIQCGIERLPATTG